MSLFDIDASDTFPFDKVVMLVGFRRGETPLISLILRLVLPPGDKMFSNRLLLRSIDTAIPNWSADAAAPVLKYAKEALGRSGDDSLRGEGVEEVEDSRSSSSDLGFAK